MKLLIEQTKVELTNLLFYIYGHRLPVQGNKPQLFLTKEELYLPNKLVVAIPAVQTRDPFHLHQNILELLTCFTTTNYVAGLLLVVYNYGEDGPQDQLYFALDAWNLVLVCETALKILLCVCKQKHTDHLSLFRMSYCKTAVINVHEKGAAVSIENVELPEADQAYVDV